VQVQGVARMGIAMRALGARRKAMSCASSTTSNNAIARELIDSNAEKKLLVTALKSSETAFKIRQQIDPQGVAVAEQGRSDRRRVAGLRLEDGVTGL
jgi:predicted methyltransferase MtxX (methanogen marker protein 4)